MRGPRPAELVSYVCHLPALLRDAGVRGAARPGARRAVGARDGPGRQRRRGLRPPRGLAEQLWYRAVAGRGRVADLHLQWGADAARQVAVSWRTPDPVRDPFVEMGRVGRVPARTLRYPGCAGFLHHARVPGLEPDTLYPYRLGHRGRAVSGTAWFRTVPAGVVPVSFTASPAVTAGRPGAPGPGVGPQGGLAGLILGQNPAFHLLAGLPADGPWQGGWGPDLEGLQAVARRKPVMPCPARREQVRGGAGPAAGPCPGAPAEAYRYRFALPDNGWTDLAGCFYAFRAAGVVVLSLDLPAAGGAAAGRTTGQRQYRWAARTLTAAAASPDTAAVVVLAQGGGTDAGARPVPRDWHRLFQRGGVDLVILGARPGQWARQPCVRGRDGRPVPRLAGGAADGEPGPAYVTWAGGPPGGEPSGNQAPSPADPNAQPRSPAPILRVDVEPPPGGGGAVLRLAAVGPDGEVLARHRMCSLQRRPLAQPS